MNLLFDVGGTHTRIARASGGKLLETIRIDTARLVGGYRELEQRLEQLCNGVMPRAIVGDVPGDIDRDGRLIRVRNLPAWQNINLLQELQQKFKCKVSILNDVVLCGIGEAHHGSGITNGEMAYVTISTGVNAVRLIDGWPDPSLCDNKLGWQLVSGGPQHAVSLEELIGGAAIQRRTGKHPGEIKNELYWRQSALYLARALFNLRLYWNPKLVVLGGKMMNDISIRRVEAELAALPQVFNSSLDLRWAALGDDAGLYGGITYLEKH